MSTDRVAVIPVPPPGPRRDDILRDAFAVGGQDEYFRCLRRLDEDQRVERQQAAITHRQAVTAQHLEEDRKKLEIVDNVLKLTYRLDAEIARRAGRSRAKRDAEEQKRKEQQQIQAQLDELPDQDDPAQHFPGGELHDLPPVPTAQDQGALPNELQEGAPAHSGHFIETDPDKLAYPYDPKQVNQPVSISLNKE
jgi:hypothetical protein